MLIIADTSPLRYLVVIGEPELLATIFGEVWAPDTVLQELSASETPASVRSLVDSHPAWLRTQEPNEQLLNTINPDLGRGECAALALALELNADLLLIGDAAGRREADTLGVRRRS